ncbi:DUF6850 family outer membrane beta-barrel protein [Tenacibaculum aiptasiae]|uniref:DUF6850 family outer membrane beta-barrel protein n=1 Tax=Tenacibaculum aiptasiae TaxID=426481 RepID=UPI003B5A0DB5
MKKAFTTIIILISFAKINAQDSLKVQQNLQHFYYKDLLQNFHETPFLFYINKVNNYTHTTLSYQNIQNNKAKQQQAIEETNINLQTEGIYKKNNTLFTGKIGYTRNYLDGLGWNTTNLHPYKNPVESSPIYNLAYKRGNWDNQFYRLNGNLVLPIIKDKLFTTININYKTLQFFRKKINPVPELNYLDVFAKATLYYKISPQKYIGAFGGYGSVNNKSEISYLGGIGNENIPNNTEIYSRISYGYGLIETAIFLRNTENDIKYSGGFNYISNRKNKLLYTEIRYDNTTTKFNAVDASEEILLARYTVNKVSSKVNWYNFNNGHSFSLNGKYTSGSNFRISTNGKNYDASLINVQATYQILKQTDNLINHNYGIYTSYYQLEKKDYQAVNSFNFINTSLGAFYGKDFKIKNNKIYLKAKTDVLFNLKKEKLFSNTNSRFINDVALPDFYLNTANKLNTSLQIGYQRKVKSATYLTLGTTLQQQYFFNLNENITYNKGFNYGAMFFFNITY